jgi:TonB-dependent starch-binding outer membrane protein SusC
MIMKKIYMRSSITAVLLLVLASVVLAQERTVSGRVTDENGSGMPGVNVLVRGTSTGTASDVDGRYTISVPSDQSVLVFTFVGYTTAELPVGGRSTVDVQMSPDVQTLTELVVTGYAVQEKKDITGSVGVVKAKELTAIPVGNVANQLQGRVAGVTVTGSGQPGQSARVRIRGLGSFDNNNPLYVIDGVPTQDQSTLNPNDIESISVLKDAGAASIYGSRASNGVIVVTTKSGANAGVKVNYDMYYGTQFAGKGPTDLLDTQGYADLQWLVYRNDGTTETHPIYGPSGNANPTLPSWAANTNWYDVVTDNAPIQNHDISLSGGNNNARFYGGVNYFDQKGIVTSTFTRRYSARFNSTFNVKDRVTFGENFQVSHRTGLSVGNLNEGSPISEAVYRAQPIVPHIITQEIQGTSRVFRPGEFGGTGIAPRLGNARNAYANLIRNADDRGFDVRLLGNIFADVKIMNGLNFRSNFGGSFVNGYFSDYTFATYENAENIGTPTLNEGASYYHDWIWTNTATFNRKFGEHSLLVVGGVEAIKEGIGRGLNATRAGYFSDAVSYRTLSNGVSITAANSYFITPRALYSQFLRFDYNFSEKYYLSGTMRRDGSSAFDPDNRYGYFPSITAAWRLSQESFLADNDIISDLKLRAGWGVMGNQLPTNPANLFTLFGGDVGSSNYDLTGSGTSSLQGFRPTRIGNPLGRWEENVSTNIGFDLALLNNRLEITFDWYKKETRDLLYTRTLPGIFGAASPSAENLASMENKGIDLQIIYQQKFSNDLRFVGNLTFTTYNNKITGIAPGFPYFDAGGSRIGSFNRNQPGQAMSAFFGYQVVGLFQSQVEIDNAPTQADAEPGFFRFADINGDGAITPDDRTFIGNPNPDFTYGLNLTLEWKGFDLTAFFYGSKGNDIFNYNKWWTDFWPSFQGQKSTRLLNESWTEQRTNASVPKASNKSNFSTNTQSNSYYIEDGSYLRLRNLQIGYRLPASVISKVGLSNARLYVQGVNLFTITKYSGLDPEISAVVESGLYNDRAQGVDAGNYPAVKQLLFGVNIGL